MAVYNFFHGKHPFFMRQTSSMRRLYYLWKLPSDATFFVANSLKKHCSFGLNHCKLPLYVLTIFIPPPKGSY